MDYKCKGRQCVQTTNIRGGSVCVDYKCNREAVCADYKIKGRQCVWTINVRGGSVYRLQI